MKKQCLLMLMSFPILSPAARLLSLNSIFQCKIKILDKVYDELKRFPKKRTEVDNLLNFKIIEKIDFPEDDDEIKREYTFIKKSLFKGDGEAASLAVCRYRKQILASSNLKDIQHYCQQHQIEYITTMDFINAAKEQGIFSMTECNEFITKVLASGSRLPVKTMEGFVGRKIDFISGAAKK